MKVERRFRPEPASVPAVRRFVIRSLDGIAEDKLETVRLLVSELATNAVVYGGTEFTVKVESSKTELIVSIADRGSGTPEVQTAVRPTDVHGRGLFIVRELADDWGVTPATSTAGKVVWFRLSLRESERSRA